MSVRSTERNGDRARGVARAGLLVAGVLLACALPTPRRAAEPWVEGGVTTEPPKGPTEAHAIDDGPSGVGANPLACEGQVAKATCLGEVMST